MTRPPVVIADGSDNPGGGAPCDSTFILRALLDRGIDRRALGMIWDPEAVTIANRAGVGREVLLRIGGKYGAHVRRSRSKRRSPCCRAATTRRQRSFGELRDELGPRVAVGFAASTWSSTACASRCSRPTASRRWESIRPPSASSW
jgi:microcystin degradation protein MlrC